MTNPHRKALVDRILAPPGDSPPDQRQAAFTNDGIAEPARALIDKVVKHAYKIIDEDVAAVKQTLSEDQIFELAVCAAVGQANRQLESALAALEAATKE